MKAGWWGKERTYAATKTGTSRILRKFKGTARHWETQPGISRRSLESPPGSRRLQWSEAQRAERASHSPACGRSCSAGDMLPSLLPVGQGTRRQRRALQTKRPRATPASAGRAVHGRSGLRGTLRGLPASAARRRASVWPERGVAITADPDPNHYHSTRFLASRPVVCKGLTARGRVAGREASGPNMRITWPARRTTRTHSPRGFGATRRTVSFCAPSSLSMGDPVPAW